MERKEDLIETLRVKTLDPKDLPFSEKEIQKDFDIVVCDVDYTLIDFEPGNKAGIKKIKEFFGERMGQQIDRIFQIVLEGNRKKEDEEWEHRDEYNFLMKRIASLQEESAKTFGVKVWSREAYIIIAAEKAGIKMDKKTVESARDMYWDGVRDNSRIFEGASKFLELLKKLNIPIILMTGSDAVLNVNDDLTLIYNPEFSRQYKMRRLSTEFPNTRVVTGDPIDKQYPEFFDYLFNEIRNIGNFTVKRTLVVGDSEKADLMFPRQRGYPTLLVLGG